MPFYTCIHKDGLLDDTSKQTIAQGITDIHCELTGAPRHFVHVLFDAYAPGDCYTGGAPSKVANIRGAIRLGRSQATKEAMLTRLTALWRQACPQTEMADIVVSLTENSGTNVMEGGVLLPPPKDDDAWMANHGFAPPAGA